MMAGELENNHLFNLKVRDVRYLFIYRTCQQNNFALGVTRNA